MFRQKVPKSQSASKLLKILTKRSSLKKISTHEGIYGQWPTTKKPSLFNYPSDYLKHVNNEEKQEENRIRLIKPQKKQRKLRKVPLTFSVCTTVEFYTLKQQKKRTPSKLTSNPQNRESLRESYEAPNHNFFISDSNFEYLNNEESFVEMNPKYAPVKISHERKSSASEKRMIKTANISRRKLQMSGDLGAQTFHQTEKTNIRTLSGNIQRPKTCQNLFEPEIDQIQEKKPSSLNFSKLDPKLVAENQDICSKYPLRLKDYETNFQAYKVISDLIDEQMKWSPKRLRPKSSIGFRKNNHTLKY